MTYSLLALGDSYTIGEGVPLYESFPYQTVQMLRKSDYSFLAPEIVARTGWTTNELNDGIAATLLLSHYDFISLLIGVNNEYRGWPLEAYAVQFDGLLQQALRFAGRLDVIPGSPMPGHVIVLSMPDWGVSPFADSQLPDAAGRNREQVTREIDTFNSAAERITRQYGLEFIDITRHSRQPALSFAGDGLHPSGLQYQYWAEQLARKILDILAEQASGQTP